MYQGRGNNRDEIFSHLFFFLFTFLVTCSSSLPFLLLFLLLHSSKIKEWSRTNSNNFPPQRWLLQFPYRIHISCITMQVHHNNSHKSRSFDPHSLSSSRKSRSPTVTQSADSFLSWMPGRVSVTVLQTLRGGRGGGVLVATSAQTRAYSRGSGSIHVFKRPL